MIANTEEEIKGIKKSGEILRLVLDFLSDMVKPGISTFDLEIKARELIANNNATPAFLGYSPDICHKPYPAAICACVNEEIVHGVPKSDKILESGDIVSIDCGVEFQGFFTDAATTVSVGDIDMHSKKLLEATSGALELAISQIKGGVPIGDIGHIVERSVRGKGFYPIAEFGGHGVGRKQHEEPFISNIGEKGTGYILSVGEVIAIEPIISEKEVIQIHQNAADGYTYYAADGSRSAQFEHTILVGKDKSESITGGAWYNS